MHELGKAVSAVAVKFRRVSKTYISFGCVSKTSPHSTKVLIIRERCTIIRRYSICQPWWLLNVFTMPRCRSGEDASTNSRRYIWNTHSSAQLTHNSLVSLTLRSIWALLPSPVVSQLSTIVAITDYRVTASTKPTWMAEVTNETVEIS